MGEDKVKLSKEDVELFYKLNWALLFYVNQKYSIIKGMSKPVFRDKKLEDIAKLHDKLCSNPQLIDQFVKENPFRFDEQELEIVRNWKNFIRDNFFIVIEHTNVGTIFLKPGKEPKAYGVVGLYDDLADVIPYTPFIIDTVLLPFKGKITYCGVSRSMNVTFGKSIISGLKTDYQRAKSKFGIITSLDQPIHERKESDEEILRFYASTGARRQEYENEIDVILKKNPALKTAYQQELSKSHARKAKKCLAELGASGWFAILEDVIITSGKTKDEVLQRLKEIIPPDKLDSVHVFKTG